MVKGVLPISPSFLSSKSRKCFRCEISCRPLIVFSEKSSTMSAWVFENTDVIADFFRYSEEVVGCVYVG